jgi:hypothetical protein
MDFFPNGICRKIDTKMDTKIDMTYRFTWDSEPTDEQLHVIMQEVAEEARSTHERVAKQILENIERESARWRSALHTQQQ